MGKNLSFCVRLSILHYALICSVVHLTALPQNNFYEYYGLKVLKSRTLFTRGYTLNFRIFFTRFSAMCIIIQDRKKIKIYCNILREKYLEAMKK